MWNLSRQRLSFAEYMRLKSKGYSRQLIIDYAKENQKQCNSNLCTLYLSGVAERDKVLYRGLEITPDNIYDVPINSAYIPYISEHFGLPHRRNTLVTADFVLNDKQKQILIGTLLGDGHIPMKCNYVSMLHGEKQKSYLEWKVQNLGVLVTSPIKTYRYKNKRSGRELANVYTKTIPHPFIKQLKQIFYRNKKQPDVNKIPLLDPLGLATWYCDDGATTRTHPKARICTNSFEDKILHNLIQMLYSRFGFSKIWINADNMLIFGADDSQKLKEIIKPFLPSCMLYKIGEQNA